MNFDAEGHLVCTPREVYDMAVKDAHRLLNAYLMVGTPWAFPKYTRYCDFLAAVSERTGVHTKNLYVRGSCHLGFSIAPKTGKPWVEVGHKSDLDLVIVDADYFYRIEGELRRWEERNPERDPQSGWAPVRRNDRRFNCCRDEALPAVVGVHHKKVMDAVTALAHCGQRRGVSAFLYPDWHSAQRRYENDLNLLCDGIAKGRFPSAPDKPFPRTKVAEKPGAAAAPQQPAPATAPPPAGQAEGKPPQG